MHFKTTLLATTAALSLGTAASAASLTATNLGDGAAAYALVDTGAGAELTPNLSFDAAIVSGDIGSVQRSPYDFSGSAGVTGYQGLKYFAVGPSHSASPATLTISGRKADTLNLLWGSIDGYNSIEFFAGGSSLGVISNGDITPSSTEGAGVGASYVSIFSDMAFDSVVFTSTSNAFEFGNVGVATVPLPAGVVLLGTALGGLGVARRRKAKKAAV
ncbi:MAG: VPLPA-CTERM sorting domain-containing protein [Pseudomonadota bacterium]